MRSAAILLVVLALVAALVVAQEPPRTEVAVEDTEIDGPIVPFEPAQRVDVPVHVPCRPGTTQTVFVRGSFQGPPAFAATRVIPTEVDVGGLCDAGAQVTIALPVELAFDRAAPAFTTVKLSLVVHARENWTDEQGMDHAPATGLVVATPGYFNLYNVRVDQKMQKAGPQERATYEVVIDNFSNGDTRFEFRLADPDDLPEGFQPVVPAPLVLQSNATGGRQTSGTVAFNVYTPFHNGYVNDIGAITLVVDSMFAPDTSIKGTTSEISTLTQARGFYVPGFTTAFLVLALAGAALAIGRRTER